MSKVCVITGGSSGIGLATARALRDRGCTVYALSRRGTEEPGIRSVAVDVTREDRLSEAVARIYTEAGRVDAVINCAGFGISGAVEFTPTEDAKRQFEVNFFGMVNMNRVVLSRMREQGGGRIVNISSVAGAIPIPFQTYYSACKAAVNSYTMALANEVKPFGVQVCCVQPGDIRTGFTDAREKLHTGDDVYQGRISRSVSGMEKDERSGMPPERAAAHIARVVCQKRVKPIHTIGFFYQMACLLARWMPAKLLNYFVGKMYAA